MYPIPIPPAAPADKPQSWDQKSQVYHDALNRDREVAVHKPDPPKDRPTFIAGINKPPRPPEPFIGKVQSIDDKNHTATLHNGKGPITFREPDMGRVQLYSK